MSMTTAILEGPSQDMEMPEPCDASIIINNLTQQEIERGLMALHQAIFPERYPFIVLVEDENLEAELFRMALREVGIAVEFMHFQDGQQASDFFSGRGPYSDREKYPLPQLTLLDFNLTRRSGLQILKEIRTTPCLEELVVVALTGSNDPKEKASAKALAIDGWFGKPDHFRDRVKFVRSLFKKWLPPVT